MKLIAVLLMALALIACEQRNEPTEESGGIPSNGSSSGNPPANGSSSGNPPPAPRALNKGKSYKDLYIVVLHTIHGKPAKPNENLVADSYDAQIIPSNLETLAENGYQLIDIIKEKGEFYYYFQKK